MLRELSRMQTDGLIEPDEHASARASHLESPWKHTIGYELEVFPSAAADVPNGATLREQADSIHSSSVSPYGYFVGSDAYYELSSPHARHPHALEIATRGMVRGGYLPVNSDGWVGSHISIGTTLHINGRRTDELTRVLRIVELLGGSSAMRLSAPLRKAADWGSSFIDDYSWAVRGQFGLSVVNATNSFKGRSEGSDTTIKNRAEFRSLAYTDPEQFGRTLETIYFLTRGVLSRPHTPQREAWDALEDWLLHDSCLPDHLTVSGHRRSHEVARYLGPYIEKIADGDTEDVSERAVGTALIIRSAIQLNHIPTLLEDAA